MKAKTISRFMVFLLALIMVVQVLPLSATAAGTDKDPGAESAETETFTVKYVDGFGNTLYKKTVKSGESVKPYGKRPHHPGFLFTCWDKKLPEKITEDITITALWRIDETVPFTLTVFSDLKATDGQQIQQAVSTAVKNRGEVAALATTGNLVARYDDRAVWNQIRNAVWTLPEDMYFYNVAGPSDVNEGADYAPFLEADLCRACNLNYYAGGTVWFQRSSRECVMLLGVGYQRPADAGVEKEKQDIWVRYVNDAVRIHAGYSVVLLVSDYMDADGNLTPFGKLLEEQVVAVNDNIRLVICGGAEGTAHTEKDYGGHKVNTVLVSGGADGMTNFVFNLTDHSVDVAPVSGGGTFSLKNAF